MPTAALLIAPGSYLATTAMVAVDLLWNRKELSAWCRDAGVPAMTIIRVCLVWGPVAIAIRA